MIGPSESPARGRHSYYWLTPEEKAALMASVVADYVAGSRQREIKKKYRISGEQITEFLKEGGVSARVGGKRIWVNKRVRLGDETELRCTKCSETKLIELYPPQGLICTSCQNNRQYRWRGENSERAKRTRSAWHKNKKKTDPRYRAICAMKCRLVRVLGDCNQKKSGKSIISFLGISRAGFIAHIEGMMLPGMTWENRSIGVWHIDHLLPCSIFDHTNPIQVRECWHYTNLRPLWGPENMHKHAKITIDSLPGPKICAVVTGE